MIVFVLVETENVANIHKRVCAVNGSRAVDKNIICRWAQKITRLEQVERPSCMMCHALDVPIHSPGQTCRTVLNSVNVVNELIASLQFSSQL